MRHQNDVQVLARIKNAPASSPIMCIENEKENACKAEKKCYREYALTI